MNAASTVLARWICGLVFGPVDRTVCRFAEVTHHGRQQ